ncbi:MAG: hypothetical protein ACKV2T_16270 [Kofleriaceae bacterium]
MSALRLRMRTSIAAALVLLSATSASAGSGRGDPPPGRGEDGGRLGRVSKGVGDAVGGTRSTSGSAGHDPDFDREYHGMYRRMYDGNDIIIVDYNNRLVRRITPKFEPNRLPASFDLFLGLQKVVESDTSFSVTAAITDDWFRLAGYGTRYWEERMDGAAKLTMTMGGATLGLPVQQGGGSRAFIEGGVALLKTSNNVDPDDDSSITGGKIGLHLEQDLRGTKIIGDLHALLFEADVKAWEGRLALRYKHFEAAFRILDFNVGPALYGPELGVSF